MLINFILIFQKYNENLRFIQNFDNVCIPEMHFKRNIYLDTLNENLYLISIFI